MRDWFILSYQRSDMETTAQRFSSTSLGVDRVNEPAANATPLHTPHPANSLNARMLARTRAPQPHAVRRDDQR